MKAIKYGNLLFSVDIDRTREYYKKSTLCDCDSCKFYSQNISGRFLELEDFLASFGVDVTKPDETAPIKTDYGILYTMVGYTVCGQIEQGENEEVEIDGFKLGFCNDFDFPNEQTVPYFSITIHDLKLT